MFYRLKDRIRRRIFSSRVQGLIRTPPLMLGNGDSPVVLSQLQHKDVLMYLAAVKSFASHVPPNEIHVLDDGSLTSEDRTLIAHHVPKVQFHALDVFREPHLPTGGTWERLIAIARLTESRYVIQLDADTLTTGPIDEVAAAVRANRAFTIGTWDGQSIEPVLEQARRTRKRNPVLSHVQMTAEAHFDQLADADGLRYVRGCSGFAGFPAGGDKLELMTRLSSQMQRLIGDKWMEWGSEQVMSNLIVANQPKAMVLPHPDYTDCQKIQKGMTRFVHFIGTCRFKNGLYADMINSMDWGAL